MTLKDHATEAERLVALGDEEAVKWLSAFKTLNKLPSVVQDLISGAFKAGYLKGVERTSELLAKRMDQAEKLEPGRKDYGDGEGGPVS